MKRLGRFLARRREKREGLAYWTTGAGAPPSEAELAYLATVDPTTLPTAVSPRRLA